VGVELTSDSIKPVIFTALQPTRPDNQYKQYSTPLGTIIGWLQEKSASRREIYLKIRQAASRVPLASPFVRRRIFSAMGPKSPKLFQAYPLASLTGLLPHAQLRL